MFFGAPSGILQQYQVKHFVSIMFFDHAWKSTLFPLKNGVAARLRNGLDVLLPSRSDFQVGASNQDSQRTNVLRNLPAERLLPANCGHEEADFLCE